MFDLKYVKENRDAFIYSLKNRGMDETVVNKIIENYDKMKDIMSETEKLRHERNEISKNFKQQDENTREKGKKIKERISELEKEYEKLSKEADELFFSLPNLLDKETPIGKTDADNVEIKKVGEIKEKDFEVKSHIDLGIKRDLIDVDTAANVTGSRFFYLKGKIAQLQVALELYSLNKLASKGLKIVIPPLMLKKEVYAGLVPMATFDDALYKVTGIEDTGENERYLISTTEHPLIAMFSDKTLKEEELPIKLAGLSAAFRKEAGAHGKDTKGIFRVHQFYQTEQIAICKPDESNKIQEEFLQNAEEMWQELGIPYHVVRVCSGDMGIRDTRQFDIEAYIYTQKKYREVGSFDNCTDWISRRSNIKIVDKEGKKYYAHTVDSTGIAVERAILAIMEYYQEHDGTIKIPKVLAKYCGFEEI
ncbi:MAG: serine--tRNA ligase [Nanoarchaeota archaeon]|nr:serine--tRNA ligase [Nanoarchaeota archaeon]